MSSSNITGTLQTEDVTGFTITMPDGMDYFVPRGEVVVVVDHTAEDLITLNVNNDFQMREGL